MSRRIIRISIISMAIFIGIIALQLASPWIGYSHYRTFERGDGAYKVVVLRKFTWTGLPGQASDAPGRVQLYGKNDTLISEADVEMVQIVDEVEWGDGYVRVPLVATWSVPKYENK